MTLSWKKIAIIFAVGVPILMAGLVTGILWYRIYDSIFVSQLSLTPTSTNFEMWRETPIPMYLKLHMFNWTNPEECNAESDAKPDFVEMGPYVFRQVDYKVNEVWNNDNHTITHQRRRIWHFDEELSIGSLTDKVTNLNPVAATVASTLRYTPDFAKDIIDRLMLSLGHKLVITKTVGELLFDGYNDTMLVIAKKFNMSAMPYTKFGWFYGRNNSDTYDGTFTMDTGAADMLELGLIREWNYSNRTNFYKDECANIRGTNGDLWPPLPNNRTVSIFVSDICTDLKLTYENETTFQGLIGNRYVSDKTMLDDGTLEPSRKCYYPEPNEWPVGTMNISLCKFNAPVLISAPHFYLADPSYRDNITGMEPNKERHEMKLVLQPVTGVPMRVKAQLQLNLVIEPDMSMSMFRDIKKTVVPMMWFTQEANLTAEYADKVKLILTLPSFGAVSCFAVAAIGIVLSCIGIFLCVRRKWQSEETQVLLPRSDSYGVTGVLE